MKIIKNLTFLFVSMLVACSSPVKDALKLAGQNKSELSSVLDYYREKQDSNRYESANFLIHNMPYHFTTLWDNLLRDSADAFMPGKYKNKKAVRQAMDYLSINYVIKEVDPDIKRIKANLLINRIESAYEVNGDSSWAGHYAQEDFNEFVLPYRIAHENLENWWVPMRTRLKRVLEVIETEKMDSVVAMVDKELSNWFRYDARYAYYSPDMSYSEAINHKGGLCNHCTDLATMGLRSLGIPSAIDYVPAWGNYSSAHTWNAVQLENNRWKPFNLGEYHKEFKFFHRPPKIFRKTFSINKGIMNDLEKCVEVPLFMRIPLFRDVTNEYVEAFDIRIKQPITVEEKALPVISVFSDNRWKPVWYGFQSGDKIKYTNMGANVLYLPQYYSELSTRNISYPLWLTADGKIVECIPDANKRITISKLYQWQYHWRMYKENSTHNKEYSLLMWRDNEWLPIANTKSQYGGCDVIFDIPPEEINDVDIDPDPKGYYLVFENVPAHGVYRLDEKNQRPFVVRGGRIIYL